MRKEQSATILYSILGCIVGYLSLYSNNFFHILLLIFGVYFATVIPVTKKITVEKLTRWLLSNTFLTYILVWLIVYILLSNVLV